MAHRVLLEQLDLPDLPVLLDQTVPQVSQVVLEQLVRREHQAVVGPVEQQVLLVQLDQLEELEHPVRPVDPVLLERPVQREVLEHRDSPVPLAPVDLPVPVAPPVLLGIQDPSVRLVQVEVLVLQDLRDH